MLVIADNLSVRNAAYREALNKKDKKAIAAMAAELQALGADMINVQVSRDGVGDEELLPFAAEASNGAVERITAALRGWLRVRLAPRSWLQTELTHSNHEFAEVLSSVRWVVHSSHGKGIVRTWILSSGLLFRQIDEDHDPPA